MTAARVTAALLLAGSAGLVVALAAHWGADPAAVDRYLVLAGAAWAAWSRRKEATAGGRPRPLPGLPLVALGAALYPLGWAGWFVLANARSLPFWTLWASLALAAAGWLVARSGPRAAYRLLFPVLVVALALPPPESLLRPLQLRLQGVTADLAAAGLRLAGYPVTRPGAGFVLALPGGELGVEEACSGVTALTALTAAAAFLAFWRRWGVLRGGLLVAAAVPAVVGVNALRVVLSGVIQEGWGPAYARGGWHDALGVATTLVGLAAVLGAARLLGPRAGPGVAAASARPPAATPAGAGHAPPRWAGWAASGLLVASLAATLAAVGHGRRITPPSAGTPPLGDLSAELGGWAEHRRLPVPPHVTAMLEPDAVTHREYRSPLGQTAEVWVIAWGSADAVRGYHHPDVCLPNAGYAEAGRGEVRLAPAAGGAVPATARTMAGPGGGELYVLYWTQTGRRVWGAADEAEAQASLTPDRTLSRAFARWRDPAPPEPAGRLVVLVGSPRPTAFGKGEVDAFAAAVADDVYRLWPAAAPPVPPGE